MAIASFGTFLMKKSGNSYSKFIDIKDFPDLGGAPEMLETTTLTDRMQTFIEGIKSNEAMEFNANYVEADFSTIDALKGQELDLSVWFGGTEGNDGKITPTGTFGKFDFKGTVSVRVTGAGTNEVVGMAITIAPTTAIKLNSESASD